MKKILFTDLDGTLLDLKTYSCELVRDAIEKLKSAEVSIVFCSSKTWSEQEYYLKELGLDEPVIVENGSGIFFPKDSNLHENIAAEYTDIHQRPAVLLGKTYKDILQIVEDTSKVHYPDLKYYANQSIEEIIRITKLSNEAAEKARQRDFSETIFNADHHSDSYKNFTKALKYHGLQCIPGSKYVTITGVESDKGRAVKMLIEAYSKIYGDVTSYAAGDSLNDLAMLKEVNFPYLVQKPDDSWANIHLDKLTKVGAVGPAGWNIMADEILVS